MQSYNTLKQSSNSKFISFKDFLQLTKFNLSLTVSLSLLFGFILAKNALDASVIIPFISTLFLALGVSALNQVQEYKEDALMTRTKHRPIASGRVSVNLGLYISIGLILFSTIGIYFALNTLGVIIFLCVIITYNLFYTKAKKVTIYAAVYGAVLGVIPPLLGWLSANASVFNVSFFSLGLFYFVWQIPHFWLLNLKYHKEYEQASFPTITQVFGEEVLERITFIWLFLTVLCGVYLTYMFALNSLFIAIILCCMHLTMSYFIIQMRFAKNYLQTFIAINSYMLAIMLVLVINALFLQS